MALKITHKETRFGIGDRIRVVQKIKEAGLPAQAGKSREATFEGMVIGIKGRIPGKTFTVRRIGEAGIGVERIFPIDLPTIERIVVVKQGTEGTRRAKLYYTREKAPTEVEMIFKRATARIKSGEKKTVKSSRKTS